MKMNDRIRARRKELKLTQAVLAKLVGVNRVTVTGWESGDYEPGGSNLQALAAALKCNPHWLITGNGDPDAEGEVYKPSEVFGIKRIPVLSWVQAGEWTESGAPVTESDITEWIYTTANLCDQGFALKVRGDSMTNPNGAPSIPEGSLVVVDPDYGSTYEVNGKIVVAQLMGSTEATLKKFVMDGPLKYLVPLNPNYRVLEVNGNCKIVGVVRQVVTDL
ncbi:LexA family transcriptional repressor [Escherichia coli]|uniref:LexA family protein n=1 Tax=Escherichia coli TaxID=562 RepID=UPI0017E87021|nr:LexA family transcriptional regulator [Escherichia coli]EFE6859264.1 LexA family transcriptional repressor [Escherichia coli]EGB2408932.1 LexA family transcriptional regulator [Escherichia coli]EKO1175627.1 LexA family transcriptional regulator [Escherichia coli]MCB4483540.1 LexA family transcriptional regulator [Escherichia coli]CAK0702991.1 LexA family transcriptional regulator [Escherichia coli]